MRTEYIGEIERRTGFKVSHGHYDGYSESRNVFTITYEHGGEERWVCTMDRDYDGNWFPTAYSLDRIFLD